MSILSNFKKWAIVATLGLSAVTLVPSANAIIGLALGNIPLIAIGGGLTGLGVVTMAKSTCSDCMVPFAVGLWFEALPGIVLLDANRHPTTPQFAALTSEQGADFNLTADQTEDYNSKLTVINSMYQTIDQDTMGEAKANPGMTARELGQFVEQRWTDAGSEAVSEHALTQGELSTLMAIRQAFAAKIQQK